MYKSHERALEALARRGRRRALAPIAGVDFSSNDYLALAASAELKDAARAAIEAMPVPFDQAIIDNPPGSRAKVKTAIDSLYTLAESLVQAGTKLEVTLLLE